MYLLYMCLAAVMLLLDYITKWAAASRLAQMRTLAVFEGVFHLTYCENTGAAFGIFAGKPYLLAAVSCVMIAAVIVYVAIKKPKSHLLMLSLTMIISGGLGNVIDRVTKGYVVDFFDFRIINFAIFNVADIFVCCGVALLAVYMLFTNNKTEKKI